jgi:hypothetical protein
VTEIACDMDYHMNLPTPSLSLNKNTHIVTALMTAYQISSKTSPQAGTSAICALNNTYGIIKYRGSSKGVGMRVNATEIGRGSICKSV